MLTSLYIDMMQLSGIISMLTTLKCALFEVAYFTVQEKDDGEEGSMIDEASLQTGVQSHP